MHETARMNGTRESILLRLVIALGVLVALTSLSACGQIRQVQLPKSPTGANDAYLIEVSFDANSQQCVYEIKNYDDPDRFLIKPGGVIAFHSTVDNVSIEVTRNESPGKHYGVRGLRSGQLTSFTMRNGDYAFRNARDTLTRPGEGRAWNHTDHKIWIVCVVGPEGSEKEIPAIDWITANEGSGGMSESGFDGGSSSDVGMGGPSMKRQPDKAVQPPDDDTPPKRATGGPTMEIDDP